MEIDTLRRLFAYDDWANRETLASLEAAGARPDPALGRMAHLLGTEWLWLSRLKGEPTPVAVWPELALAECRREANRLSEAWRQLLAGLSAQGLARRVAYVNSKGEPWESSTEDILMHVVLHGVHHRGQIAADLRAAGLEPAYTDFIHAVRQRRIE